MWESFCDHLRQCGRSGNLFVLVIFLIFSGSLFGPWGLGVLLGILGLYLLWVAAEISRLNTPATRLGRLPPLAREDLRIARHKLARSQTQRILLQNTQRLRTQRPAGRTGGSPSPLRLRPR